MLADGDSAKLTPADIARVIDPIRDDVHQVQPHAISITQASEYGCSYHADELASLGEFAAERGLGMHMDGARFANAVAFLDCNPTEAVGPCDTLSFGFIKNGGLSAEAVILFDPARADEVRYRRNRAGHLQCKGRYLAAQILAMLKEDIWLQNASLCRLPNQEVPSKQMRYSCDALRVSEKHYERSISNSTIGVTIPRVSLLHGIRRKNMPSA